jgi:hypothetical protein
MSMSVCIIKSCLLRVKNVNEMIKFIAHHTTNLYIFAFSSAFFDSVIEKA